MLAKKERLNREAFNRFFASGKRYHSPNFQLIHSPFERFHGSVVVGKKVFKSAVRRNRLRRQVYGQLYRAKATGPQTGVYILIAKPSAGTLTKAKLAPEVETLLAQAR